uniref:Adipokinetic hormone n=1 Tax=Steinernema glaseri TaxID=37863 RepID=A0A1I7YWW8_9BILA
MFAASLLIVLLASSAVSGQMTFSDGWGKRSAPSAGSFINNDGSLSSSKFTRCNQAYSEALGQIHGEMTKVDAAFQQCQREASRLSRRSMN